MTAVGKWKSRAGRPEPRVALRHCRPLPAGSNARTDTQARKHRVLPR